MDEMDGLETLRQLRNDAESVPVVVVSSAREKYIPAMCRNFGVHAFVPKPVRTKVLCESIDSAVGK